MANTAVVTIPGSATVSAGAVVPVVCTVTNGSGAVITILGIAGTIKEHTSGSTAVAAMYGSYPIMQGFTVTVAASGGTLAVPTNVVAYAPIPAGSGGEPQQILYDIGANVTLSTGETLVATVATLTVNPVTVF